MARGPAGAHGDDVSSRHHKRSPNSAAASGQEPQWRAAGTFLEEVGHCQPPDTARRADDADLLDVLPDAEERLQLERAPAHAAEGRARGCASTAHGGDAAERGRGARTRDR
jgi:hypothetical protein